MKRTPMTLRGAERLRQELKQLKSEARPNVIKAIAEARSHGDLSENAEYHAAREQQSFIEGRINDIENRLSNAEVIDVTKLTANGRVVFGSTVELEDQDGGSKVVYQLVGDDEADIKHGMLSVSSPIARALIGKSEGDVVDVTVPGGTAQLRSHVGALCVSRAGNRGRPAPRSRAKRLPRTAECSGPAVSGRSPCGWRRRCSSCSPTGISRGLLAARLFAVETYLGVAVAALGIALPGRGQLRGIYIAVALLAINEWIIKGCMEQAHAQGAAIGLSFGALARRLDGRLLDRLPARFWGDLERADLETAGGHSGSSTLASPSPRR